MQTNTRWSEIKQASKQPKRMFQFIWTEAFFYFVFAFHTVAFRSLNFIQSGRALRLLINFSVRSICFRKPLNSIRFDEMVHSLIGETHSGKKANRKPTNAHICTSTLKPRWFLSLFLPCNPSNNKKVCSKVVFEVFSFSLARFFRFGSISRARWI